MPEKIRGSKKNIKIAAVLACMVFFASFLRAEENFFSGVFFEDFPALGRGFSDEPFLTGAVTLGLGAAGYVLMKNDAYLREEIRAAAGTSGDVVLGFFNEAGDAVNVLAGCAVLYSIGTEKEKRAAYDTARALAVAGIISTSLKIVLGRDRPSAGTGPYMYRPFRSFDDSLPSGHTTVAFAWAAVIAGSYAEQSRGFSYFAYAAAAATGIARVYFNRHWPSDVLLGAVIGIAAGQAAIADDNGKEGLSITPAGISYVVKY